MYEINSYYNDVFDNLDEFLAKYKNKREYLNQANCIYDEYNPLHNIYIKNKGNEVELGVIKNINNRYMISHTKDKDRINDIIKSIAVPKLCNAIEIMEYLNTHDLHEEDKYFNLALNIMNDMITKRALHIYDIAYLDKLENELKAIDNLSDSFTDKKIWIEEVFSSFSDNNLSLDNYNRIIYDDMRKDFFNAIPYDRDKAYDVLMKLEEKVVTLREVRNNKELIDIAVIDNNEVYKMKIEDEVENFQAILDKRYYCIPLVNGMEAYISGDHIDLHKTNSLKNLDDILQLSEDKIIFNRYDKEKHRKISLTDNDFKAIKQHLDTYRTQSERRK